MSTYYLLPPRPLLAERCAGFLSALFPGLDWTRAALHDLAGALDAMASDHPDVYVVHREDLPEGEDPARALEAVRSVPGVAAASPFTLHQVMLVSARGVAGAVLQGIDPASKGQVGDLGESLRQGSLSDLAPAPVAAAEGALLDGVLLGRSLAFTLGVTVGDVVTVLSPLGGGISPLGVSPRLRRFRVAGIFSVGMHEYDSSLAYVAIPAAQQFFRLGQAVTGIEVRLNDFWRAGEVAEALEGRLGPPHYTRTWVQMYQPLFAALRLEKITMFIILVMIVVDERPGVSRDRDTPGFSRRLRGAGLWLPILGYADGYGFTYGARVSFIDALGDGSRISVPLTWGGERRAAGPTEHIGDRVPALRVPYDPERHREQGSERDLDPRSRFGRGRAGDPGRHRVPPSFAVSADRRGSDDRHRRGVPSRQGPARRASTTRHVGSHRRHRPPSPLGGSCRDHQRRNHRRPWFVRRLLGRFVRKTRSEPPRR